MLSDELKRLRKEEGFTQAELAERLNLSQATIASWENGTRRPDIEYIPVLAELYGISIDALFGVKKPTVDEPNRELSKKYDRLTHDNQIRLSAYLDGLLSSQQH